MQGVLNTLRVRFKTKIRHSSSLAGSYQFVGVRSVGPLLRPSDCSRSECSTVLNSWPLKAGFSQRQPETFFLSFEGLALPGCSIRVLGKRRLRRKHRSSFKEYLFAQPSPLPTAAFCCAARSLSLRALASRCFCLSSSSCSGVGPENPQSALKVHPAQRNRQFACASL